MQGEVAALKAQHAQALRHAGGRELTLRHLVRQLLHSLAA